MTSKTISIKVLGTMGRYRTVVVETPTTLGTLSFKFQVDLFGVDASPVTEQVRLQDAVIKALAEVVKHPAFEL